MSDSWAVEGAPGSDLDRTGKGAKARFGLGGYRQGRGCVHPQVPGRTRYVLRRQRRGLSRVCRAQNASALGDLRVFGACMRALDQGFSTRRFFHRFRVRCHVADRGSGHMGQGRSIIVASQPVDFSGFGYFLCLGGVAGRGEGFAGGPTGKTKKKGRKHGEAAGGYRATDLAGPTGDSRHRVLRTGNPPKQDRGASLPGLPRHGGPCGGNGPNKGAATSDGNRLRPPDRNEAPGGGRRGTSTGGKAFCRFAPAKPSDRVMEPGGHQWRGKAEGATAGFRLGRSRRTGPSRIRTYVKEGGLRGS